MTMTLLKATLAVTVLAATASTANGQDFPPEAYPHPYPVARFTPWKYIQDTASVDALNYREFTWNFATNYESANIIEDVPYAALTPQEAEAAANLGISPESWDCWIHHYDGYNWDELPLDAVNAFSVLGYDEDLWQNGGVQPDATVLFWDQLSPDQRDAAVTVCYTQQMWDEISLDTRVLYFGTDGIAIPETRLTPWSELTADQQANAGILGYTEATWNLVGSDRIENDSWFDRSAIQQDAIIALGFDPWTWDCTMNHYNDYDWVDFESVELQMASILETFGWNATSWDNDEINPQWDVEYADLTPEQKIAAAQLCWLPITWNGELNVADMTEAPTISPSLSPSSVPTISPSGAPSVTPTLSISPSAAPTNSPTIAPSDAPSGTPSTAPTLSSQPSRDTPRPSTSPSDIPSEIPSVMPSIGPSDFPSSSPSMLPSDIPSVFPSSAPTTTTPEPTTLPPTPLPTTLSPTVVASESPSISAQPSVISNRGPVEPTDGSSSHSVEHWFCALVSVFLVSSLI